ncbi:hypothetical protein [Brochothrix phage ADU4]|nr:hypothetical protein [Brochothrix phage ADU4]
MIFGSRLLTLLPLSRFSYLSYTSPFRYSLRNLVSRHLHS